MKAKILALAVFAIAGLASAAPAQASSMQIEIPPLPFWATAVASSNAYQTPGQNRLAVIDKGARIKFVECNRSYCKTILSDGVPAWVTLEYMRDYEHVPERVLTIKRPEALTMSVDSMIRTFPLR